MGKIAIKLKDLNALVEKYKRGNAVLWKELVEEAQGKLYKFNGVGRINNAEFIMAACAKITKKNRYVHTMKDIAKTLGTTAATFYRWREAGLVKPQLIDKQIGSTIFHHWVYDTKDVQRQIKRQVKKQSK